MIRHVFTPLAVATLASSALLIGPAVAQADEICSPALVKTPRCAPPEGPPGQCDAFGTCSQVWCPGSNMIGIPDWDKTRCHSFYFDPNSPSTKPVIIAGQPPGPPPPPPPPCIPLVNCLPGLTGG